MNWSESESAETMHASVPAEQDSAGLYLGDTGELTLDTRRALVHLLSGPSLEGRRHGKLWPVLLRDEAILRKRLSELFLELVIDRDSQVAFTKQADTGELVVPILLRRSPLTFVDSVLLLELRHRLTQAEAQGDRAVISVDELMNDLTVYDRAGSTDRAGFAKRVKASVEKFKTRSILQKIRSSEDRYEISPTLKLLFSADRVEALALTYRNLAAAGSIPQNAEAEDAYDAGDRE